jgi:hypothetical protein
MNDHTNTCTSCFPAGSQTSSRVFDNSFGAVTIYSSLHARGESPAMCQRSDTHFRVCHVRQSSSVRIEPPQTRRMA